jgi:small subunit ribosomal protein S4
MSNIIKSKSKISRKYGVNLWGMPGDAFEKKPYIPGQHGGKVMRVSKTYRKQLVEKNKLRFYHLLTERQFSNIVRSAIAARTNSTETMLQVLNTMLSGILYASGLFKTPFFGKQVISHGHVLVNGKKLDIHSAKLKVGDVVTFTEKMRNNTQVVNYLANHTPVFPSYLDVNKEKMEIKVVSMPGSATVKYPCEMHPNIVIEYYSA